MIVINLIGQRFGRLLVLRENGRKRAEKVYECKCDCGAITNVSSYALRSGETQSCGCLQRERTASANKRHGDAETSLWRRHKHMIWRCNNPRSKDYANYGGRGITVCPEWIKYENFKEWAIHNGYKEDLTIDRIDVNGNYEPSNCRWIPLAEQQRNRRNNVFLDYCRVRKTQSEWARLLGVSSGKIAYLRRKGLNDTEIFGHFPEVAALLEKMKGGE